MIVTDANGCKDSINNIIITEPTAISFTSVTHQDIICYKDSSGSITVAAAGGTGAISYSLLPAIGTQSPSGNFTNLVGGAYTVTATDASGCTKSTIVVIANNLQLVMNIIMKEPICHGDGNGAILVNVTGGVPPISFSLDGSAFTTNNLFQNLYAGQHFFTIKDLNNCVVDTAVTLTEPDKVGADITLETAKCNTLDDGKIIAQGTGGRSNYTYYLRPGLFINKHGTFKDINVGTYTLTVKDSAGCSFDTIITVMPPAAPLSITFTKQDIGCYGYGNEGWAKAFPAGGTAPFLYTWTTSPVQTTQTAEQLRWGYYGVTVIDANGCMVSDSLFISPGPCCDDIFIPSAFSPNGDGRNDEFRIVTAAGFELIQLEVYDRWGNKVWATRDATKGWDGRYKSVDMDIDTYYYIFRYNCLATGEKMMKKGDVELIR
jgi:gliding motility-associated-like protein